MARAITFNYEENYKTFDFGTYALLMYYAKELNSVKAKKMFDATLSEWIYRVNYDLPKGNLTDSNFYAHFVPSEIQESVLFIQNEVIPSLRNETQHLLEKYDGREKFREIINGSEEFIGALGIEKEEFYHDDPNTLIHIFNMLKEFFEYALTVNEPYEVLVD